MLGVHAQADRAPAARALEARAEGGHVLAGHARGVRAVAAPV